MKILGKSGSDLLILASPQENIGCGDYLLVDEALESQLVLQVYDETYLDTPGTAEEIVRCTVLRAMGVDEDPVDLDSMVSLLKDLKVLKCRSRGSLVRGEYVAGVDWLPSRVSSNIAKAKVSKLLSANRSPYSFTIGYSGDEEIHVPGEAFDASINIITGRKGSGKSHLAKVLLSKLVILGGCVIVFDVNGEYEGVVRRRGGGVSEMSEKTLILKLGKNHKFRLDYLGRQTLSSLLTHTLDTPSATVREFLRIYDSAEREGFVTLRGLHEAILGARCNELVREALLSRFYSLLGSRLFSDKLEECINLEEEFAKISDGGVLIVSLKNISSMVRRLVVEIILSKITQLLELGILPPLLLFAEEAHLYLREAFWDDVVTRMRHLGIFTTFITNQPDSLKQHIWRQVDNIFLFNLANESDMEAISKISTADLDTIRSISKTLPRGTCLAIGKVVSDLPVVLRVVDPDLHTMGESKSFLLRRTSVTPSVTSS